VNRVDGGLSELTAASREALSGQAEEIRALRAGAESAHKNSVRALEGLSRSESGVERLASEVAALPGFSECAQARLFKKLVFLPGFDSLIVSEYSPIFDEFRGKRFTLLWRGSRDGFRSGVFHRRSDGHANTLTVILDTDGNVFGGFTPVKWESRTYATAKGDDSLRSFIFTLKNPHNIPAQRFPLKADKKNVAIDCNVGVADGPTFGFDMGIMDDTDGNMRGWTQHGTRVTDRVYENGIAVEDLFTSSENFKPKDVEVFEITD
jgi:hypothetical protein